MGQTSSCLDGGQSQSRTEGVKDFEQQEPEYKQSPKHYLQRDSDEGLQGDQNCQTEHITAKYPHVDAPHSARPPRNDSALFSCVEPLEHTPPVTDEHSQRQTMEGLQYETVNLGPPKPPCNQDRLATLRALECTDGPPNPELEHIIQLACTVFGTSNALVALLDSDRIIIRNGSGMFAPGDFPWRFSFCGYTLSSPHDATMVVEDALQDARFKHNPYVNGEPPVRFYCGTPLIASNGHRLGTLCFADHEAHTFDAERCNILNNMAELCVREIEREFVIRQQSMESTEQLINAGMMRALEAFQEAILMVDTTDPQCWAVLHVNKTFVEQTGLTRQEVVSAPFWDTFELKSSAPLEEVQQRAALNKEFALSNVVLRGPEVGMDSAVESAPPALRRFAMGFRPANHGQLDNSIPIGVPSYIPSAEDSGKGIFFVSMHELSLLSRSSTVSSSILSDISFREVPFPDLEVGTLLGKGGYGSVYRGTFEGQPCAVKVIDDLAAIIMRDGKPLEASIMEGISHPNVVNIITHAVTENTRQKVVHDSVHSEPQLSSKPSRSSKRSGSSMSNDSTAWLILEFCDKGCLQEAVDKGWFRKERELTRPGSAIPDTKPILATALDIAEGVAFLHARGVVHGDLTGGNVLLTSCPSAPHGFRAKISDFGLARNLSIQSKIETRTYGTITHMPLELLCDGIMSKACDVYAFGVLMWEMMAGCRAWASMKHAQIMHSIVVERKALQFPAHTPPAYKALAQRCLSYTPDQRPSFAEVISGIREMQASLDGLS